MDEKRLGWMKFGKTLGAAAIAFGALQCGGAPGTAIIDDQDASPKTDNTGLASSGGGGTTTSSGRVIGPGSEGTDASGGREAGKEAGGQSIRGGASEGADASGSAAIKDSGQSDSPSDGATRADGHMAAACACGDGQFCCLNVCCTWQQTCCVSSTGSGSCTSNLICPF